jgi:hypothetical protein
MGAMKKLLDLDFLDEQTDCEDCGEACESVQLGRRWCKDCWEAFADDYQQFLFCQEMETSRE